MIESHEFLHAVMDSITEQIAVIDDKGAIQFTNKAWNEFGEENALAQVDWLNLNYLNVCDEAAELGDELAGTAASGIRQVIRGELDTFYHEYPCHSPDEKRWFMMRVRRFDWQQRPFYVISHHNITERKLAEEKALDLSRTDGLTGLANRRHFNEFLATEWRRCSRQNQPLSLAIFDIDYFKLLNDHYGHLVGDDCLVVVGRALKDFCHRPSDLIARYGGEEFAVVMAGTAIDQALAVTDEMVEAVRELEIPHLGSPMGSILTVSVGLATLHPDKDGSEQDLIRLADQQLYAAKKQGRNQVVYSPEAGVI